MALVREFSQIQKATNHVHGEVECGWTTFEDAGATYLQLDTYGSGHRRHPGK